MEVALSMYKANRLRFVAVLALMLSLAASASAALFIVSPPRTILPTLRTYNQSAADWWKWLLAQPASVSPLLDVTGAQCGRGQPLLGAWYLAGAPSDAPVTRSCTIPNFRTILIPVLNGLSGAFPTDPADQRTEAYVRGQLGFIKNATNLTLTIDGTPVRNVADFYEQSTLFSVTLPQDNIYELPAGTMLNPAADAGYYVAISGLLPGNHTITWHSEVHDATAGDFEQNVTYNIRVNLL